MSNEDQIQSTPDVLSFTIAGILAVLFGLLAIATPFVAGTAVVLVIGIILLVTGIMQFGLGFYADTWPSRLLQWILGLVTVICGAGVMAHPLAGLKFLTLLLIIFFVTEGIWKIIASFSFRSNQGWFFVLLSGIVSLILGVLIGTQWPVSGAWAVGLLVGINLLFTGMSLLALAFAVHRLKKLASTKSAVE